MKSLINCLEDKVQEAFEACGYEKEYGALTYSNRPELCQFQCNGALVAAQAYRKAPFDIGKEVISVLEKESCFKQAECVMPGFINLSVSDEYLVDYLMTQAKTSQWGCEKIGEGHTLIIDYGGPNVAKPLHVGHLRTAIIGESIKRMARFLGYQVLGDVHLGDWGLQIGLIITELKKRYPSLIYFDPGYKGPYPEKAPFNMNELEEIYPKASSFAKLNPWFMDEAKQATYLFQNGHPPYVALWKHILEVSIADLKKNYANLNVYFDLWKKESDAQPYIPQMIKDLKEKGFAYESEGALVVDVKEESDTKAIPPCIIVKSNGATLYSTTDLATIVERMDLYTPDEIIYIVDKRQSMHFEQVFRCAKKTGLVPATTKLTFLGFGTMNGKDGKPFKTREGGVMRLEHLIQSVSQQVYEKVSANKEIDEAEAWSISKKVGIAALKYGDLSNQIAKDYVFDLERFTSFEGNTGPYILYTVVRIKSILNKFYAKYPRVQIEDLKLQPAHTKSERALMLILVQFNEMLINSFKEYAPHRICQYIYELSNTFNKFYHEHNILNEENQMTQESWIKLIDITQNLLETCVNLLGIEVPDKM